MNAGRSSGAFRRISGAAGTAGAAVALAGGLWTAAGLLAATWPLERLPLWDGAGNGWGAVEVWAALAEGRLFDALLRLNAQDIWPFGFSLLLLPIVAIEGGSFQALTLVPALAFALVPVALVWAAVEIDRGDRSRSSAADGAGDSGNPGSSARPGGAGGVSGRGIAAGLLAGALWLTSPLARVLATVIMRETTGALLGTVALVLYLRARRLGTLGAWRALGGALLALVLVKYNYALVSGAALALHALTELPAGRRRELAAIGMAELRHRRWRSPLTWLLVLSLLAGMSLALGANPGILLYLAIVAVTILRVTPPDQRMFARWPPAGALPPPLRGLIETLGIPLWIWSLSPVPNHLQSVFSFLRNRPGDQPVVSIEALAFYPRAVAQDLMTSGYAAGAIAMVLIVGSRALTRRGDPLRAAVLSVVIGALALLAHPLKEARFLVSGAPLIFLAASVVAVRGATAWRASSRRFAVLGPPLTLLVVAAVALPGAEREASARLVRDHRTATSPGALVGALNATVVAVANDSAPVAFLGGFNQLSGALVRWEAWRSTGREPGMVRPLRGLDGSSSTPEVRRRLESWLQAEHPARVVALRPLRRSADSRWLDDPDYSRYNAWQIRAIEALESAGGFAAVRRREFPGEDLELLVFEPR